METHVTLNYRYVQYKWKFRVNNVREQNYIATNIVLISNTHKHFNHVKMLPCEIGFFFRRR